jgi:iron complex outermembrane receptor protein
MAAAALAAAALAAAPALAADQAADRPAQTGDAAQTSNSPPASGAARATGSRAAQAAPTTTPENATLEDVVVTAHTLQTSMAGGGMIAVQETPVVRTTIGQGFIAKQLPISNTLATIRLAPGVNVGQDNPFGVSERSDVSVRGIDQTQMGFVSEGIPGSDPDTYLPDGNELIDNENAKAVTITQGTSDLASPVLSASGGLIEVQMRDPSHDAGGTLSASAGSESAHREFARLDTGDIFATGVRSYVSYSDTQADDWRGSGHSDRVHVDFKALRDWSSGSQSELFIQYNYLNDARMSIPTLAQFDQYGPYGTRSNYASTYSFGQTQYYKFFPFLRKVMSIGAPQKILANDAWSFNITPYFRYSWGDGPGGTVLDASHLYFGNQPYTNVSNVSYVQNGRFTVNSQAYISEYEPGAIASATYKQGGNSLTVGGWVENLDVVTRYPFIAVAANGNIAALTDANFVKVGNGQTLYAQDWNANRQTTALFVSDEWRGLEDRLKVMFGVKELLVDVTGNNYLPGATPVVSVFQHLLTPRLGATYDVTTHGQVFFDLTTNARPPSVLSYFDAYNVSTGKPTAVGYQGQKAEYSFQQEVGYRYQSEVNVSIAYFHSVLQNHQVNTIVNQNGSLVQSYISAGSEGIEGVDGEVGLRPWHNFSPYISAQYLHATTLSDIQSGNDFVPTRGRVAVRSPPWQAAAGLTYDDGSLFAVVTAKWVDSQYSTFMDDQRMPSYSQVDFGVGYHLPDLWYAKRPTIQLNLTNLGNKAYLGSVASPTLNARATIGQRGTLIGASQPGYYESAPLMAVVTLKSDF